MELELPQLKKRAKAKGILKEAIEVAVGGADDEFDAKSILISLILKAACVKATPSPTRARTRQPEEDLQCQMCLRCVGCIRPPNHEGPCMDGNCNDIVPEPVSSKEVTGLDVAVELARHKVVKDEVLRKVEEAAAKKEQAERKAAEEAALRITAKKEAQRQAAEEETARIAAEQAQKKAAELAAAAEAQRKAAELAAEAQRKAAEEAEAEVLRQKVAEEERLRLEAEAAEEAAKKEKEEEEAKKDAARKEKEEADMAAMAEVCVDTFLESVLRRDRVRTPITGSKLYTLHIRPARRAGTSVDVKDSSFRNLGAFLKFLEDAGLLRLKPGLSDPVVTDIRLDACRNYTYNPRPQASPMKLSAPHAFGESPMKVFQ